MRDVSLTVYKSHERKSLVENIFGFFEKIPKKVYSPVKRGVDILVALIGILLTSPIFLIIPILIKLDSKGKVFFKHKRIGKNGETIYIYKFRTMVENAEGLIETFSEKQREEYEKNYKLENDFRITRIGKFLRKTSIDELPQLINILIGNMSVIGPRPVVEKELSKYGEHKDAFLSVKPGLTGYWQANGRSNTSYSDRINMELHYINNRSLLLDFQIFCKTIIAVIKREGAM